MGAEGFSSRSLIVASPWKRLKVELDSPLTCSEPGLQVVTLGELFFFFYVLGVRIKQRPCSTVQQVHHAIPRIGPTIETRC